MKRRVLIVLLLLVAGAIVNVAVAWGCCQLWDVRLSDFGTTVTYKDRSVVAGDIPTTDQVFPMELGLGWPTRSIADLRTTWMRGQSESWDLRPIWPGFAINTVFYGLVLWLLFAAPLALRRRRRIKRGLCPKCAYDLRGSDAAVCPECGATVTAKHQRRRGGPSSSGG